MKKNEEILVRDSENEEEPGLILFNPNNGKIYNLNKTGELVWKNIEKDKEDIVDFVEKKTYGADKERIVEDVESLLKKFKESGLVVED